MASPRISCATTNLVNNSHVFFFGILYRCLHAVFRTAQRVFYVHMWYSEQLKVCSMCTCSIQKHVCSVAHVPLVGYNKPKDAVRHTQQIICNCEVIVYFVLNTACVSSRFRRLRTAAERYTTAQARYTRETRDACRVNRSPRISS